MTRACLVLFLTPLASGCDHAPKELYQDHPMGLAAGALRDTAFTWETRQTDHFRIHFQFGSYAADHIDQFVEDAEQARANGLRLLSEKDFRPRIDVFHLTSREQMKRLTDYPIRGWTDPASRTVLLVRSSGANQGERHAPERAAGPAVRRHGPGDEEAVTNSMVAAETMTGSDDVRSIAFPHDRLGEILRKYNRLVPPS